MDAKTAGENVAPTGTSIAREPSTPGQWPRVAQHDPLLEFFTSKFALILGTLLASASILVAIRNAIHRSMDFQWSGAHLLLLHRDPWAVYLSGDRQHEILLSQIPLYLHELYLLLLPFGYLSFAKAKLPWAICNVCFVFILGWSVARLCELGRSRTWLLFVLVLLSTPFRVTVGNGQNDALALMCMGFWAFVSAQGARGLLLGVAYEKYSLPPVLVVFLLLRRKWKMLFYSIIPPLFGFVFIDAWLSTGWRTLALDPFRTEVHQTGGFVPGLADIMAVSEVFLRHISSRPAWSAMLPYLIAIVLACAIAAYVARNASSVDGRVLLACLLVASLACFQHQIYDFLALIFPLAVALKSEPSQPRTAVFVIIAYFCYLERVLGIRGWESNLLVILANFLLLLLLLWATYQLRNNTKWSSHWDI